MISSDINELIVSKYKLKYNQSVLNFYMIRKKRKRKTEYSFRYIVKISSFILFGKTLQDIGCVLRLSRTVKFFRKSFKKYMNKINKNQTDLNIKTVNIFYSSRRMLTAHLYFLYIYLNAI